MKPAASTWKDLCIAAALGLAALVVYSLTLSVGPYPGESARLMVQHMGLFPKLSPRHPLWTIVVRMLPFLPPADITFKLNAFSAVCGAAVVALLYSVMRAAVLGAMDVDKENRSRAVVAARLAGISAALFLAFCVPFWAVSNRAHTAAFDLLLLLSAARLFVHYAVSGKTWAAMVFAFFYGVGVVEFATFIVFAPLFALGLGWVFSKQQGFRAGPIVGIAACGLAGLCMYLMAAWLFYGSSGYELREYPGFLRIVWFMWRDQYLLITRSLPRVGWLIVVFVMFVPWLSALGVARRALNGEKDWAYYVLHAVMTGLTVGILFNAKISPWRMLGFNRLLVTPYVLAASLYGYLLAYWFLLPSVLWQDAEERARIWARRLLSGIAAVIGVGLTLVVPWLHVEEADGRPAAHVNRYAKEVLKCCRGCAWLVTDGSVDNHLILAAREAGASLEVLNLRAGNNEVYMRHVASKFTSPRYRNLAELGAFPLVQEWLRTDSNAVDRVAVLADPDLWIGAGLSYVPDRLVFRGTREPSSLDADALLSRHQEFWDRFVPQMQFQDDDGRLAAFRTHVLRHTSMVANNLGVLMEDLGKNRAAFQAYQQARRMFADNISALLNLSVMLDEGYSAPEAESIRADVKALLSGVKKYHIWSLSRFYGYVRLPQAFAQLGMTWALSGQPGLAVSRLKTAMDLLPEEDRAPVKQALADVYLVEQESEKSESLYRELLQQQPDNRRALLGMCRLSARKGDFAAAYAFLDRASDAGVPDRRVALERANVLILQGDTEQARSILWDMVKREPDTFAAWSALIGVLAAERDVEGLETCVERLRHVGGDQGLSLSVASGHLALLRNDVQEARSQFTRALALRPEHRRILTMLLRLDVMQGRKALARERAKQLLELDPGHAFANYVQGTLKLEEGRDTLAEDLFRRSLRRERAAYVLNDLAWLLQERDALEEAEALAREAISSQPETHQFWDTLGVTLMKAGRLQEAEKALDRALSLFQGDLSVFLHMADVQVRLGNRDRAEDIIAMLSEKRGQLTSDDAQELLRLRAALSR